jgi:hypothetical protein
MVMVRQRRPEHVLARRREWDDGRHAGTDTDDEVLDVAGVLADVVVA